MNSVDNRIKIRPLLSVSRFETGKFCSFWKLPIYPDASNKKVKFLRNRVRKQLLPTLKLFFNAKIENVILQFADIVEAEDKYLNQITKQLDTSLHMVWCKPKIRVEHYFLQPILPLHFQISNENAKKKMKLKSKKKDEEILNGEKFAHPMEIIANPHFPPDSQYHTPLFTTHTLQLVGQTCMSVPFMRRIIREAQIRNIFFILKDTSVCTLSKACCGGKATIEGEKIKQTTGVTFGKVISAYGYPIPHTSLGYIRTKVRGQQFLTPRPQLIPISLRSKEEAKEQPGEAKKMVWDKEYNFLHTLTWLTHTFGTLTIFDGKGMPLLTLRVCKEEVGKSPRKFKGYSEDFSVLWGVTHKKEDQTWSFHFFVKNVNNFTLEKNHNWFITNSLIDNKMYLFDPVHKKLKFSFQFLESLRFLQQQLQRYQLFRFKSRKQFFSYNALLSKNRIREYPYVWQSNSSSQASRKCKIIRNSNAVETCLFVVTKCSQTPSLQLQNTKMFLSDHTFFAQNPYPYPSGTEGMGKHKNSFGIRTCQPTDAISSNMHAPCLPIPLPFEYGYVKDMGYGVGGMCILGAMPLLTLRVCKEEVSMQKRWYEYRGAGVYASLPHWFNSFKQKPKSTPLVTIKSLSQFSTLPSLCSIPLVLGGSASPDLLEKAGFSPTQLRVKSKWRGNTYLAKQKRWSPWVKSLSKLHEFSDAVKGPQWVDTFCLTYRFSSPLKFSFWTQNRRIRTPVNNKFKIGVNFANYLHAGTKTIHFTNASHLWENKLDGIACLHTPLGSAYLVSLYPTNPEVYTGFAKQEVKGTYEVEGLKHKLTITSLRYKPIKSIDNNKKVKLSNSPVLQVQKGINKSTNFLNNSSCCILTFFHLPFTRSLNVLPPGSIGVENATIQKLTRLKRRKLQQSKKVSLFNTNKIEVEDVFYANFFLYFETLKDEKRDMYWPIILSFLPKALQQRTVKLFLTNQSWERIRFSQVKNFLALRANVC